LSRCVRVADRCGWMKRVDDSAVACDADLSLVPVSPY